MSKIVVFTDLDGTLLDENTYSPYLSELALRDLQSLGVAVVFCSSKTRAEQQVLRQELDVVDPYIVENGSSIIVPPQSVTVAGSYFEESDGTKIIVLGETIDNIGEALKDISIRKDIAFQSFSNLSDEQLAQITGLDLESVRRAKKREFSETIVTKFRASELEAFVSECSLYGLHCVQGGRFLSVLGQGADKGIAVQTLTGLYRHRHEKVITVGVGDSPNDLPMLRAVDYPYLVLRPNGHFASVVVEGLNYVEAVGPQGFSLMVEEIKHRWFNLE